MMKKFWYIAASLLMLLAACNKEPVDDGGGGGGDDTKVSVEGSWELSSVTTKASVGGVTVSVYVTFSGGSFTLYQKIGEGRYTQFTGSYTLNDKTLTGNYAGGKSWGPYTAAMSGGNLTLTSAGGKEVDTYKKIGSIPSSVTDNLY